MKFAEYTTRPIDYSLFGEEEDNDFEINLMRNIIYDINTNAFHADYLLAAVTSLLWLRCLLLLKLSENFGPLIEMFYSMSIVLSRFIVIFVIELVIFSSIAAMSLSVNPNFANMFEALRTYLSASLGSFDLY